MDRPYELVRGVAFDRNCLFRVTGRNGVVEASRIEVCTALEDGADLVRGVLGSGAWPRPPVSTSGAS